MLARDVNRTAELPTKVKAFVSAPLNFNQVQWHVWNKKRQTHGDSPYALIHFIDFSLILDQSLTCTKATFTKCKVHCTSCAWYWEVPSSPCHFLGREAKIPPPSRSSAFEKVTKSIKVATISTKKVNFLVERSDCEGFFHYKRWLLWFKPTMDAHHSITNAFASHALLWPRWSHLGNPPLNWCFQLVWFMGQMLNVRFHATVCVQTCFQEPFGVWKSNRTVSMAQCPLLPLLSQANELSPHLGGVQRNEKIVEAI